MSTVLVVDSDPRARSALAAMVRGLGHRVLEAEARAASRLLEQGEIEVLLAEMRMKGGDGSDLLRLAGELSPSTRCILTAERATAEEYKAAIARGAVDVLSAPIDPEGLATSIRRALESTGGFHGSLHGLDLLDILQMLNRARRSTVVCIGEKSEIVLCEGEIIHASCPGFAGRPALKQILMAKSGSIDTKPFEECPQTIEQRLDGLLLDLMREIDELRAGRATGPLDAAGRGEPDFADLDIFEDDPSVSSPRSLGAPFSTPGPNEAAELATAEPATTSAASAANEANAASEVGQPVERRPAPASRPLAASADSGAIQGELRPAVAEQERGLWVKPAFWGVVVVVALLIGGALFFVLAGEPPEPSQPDPGSSSAQSTRAPDAAGAVAKPLTVTPDAGPAADATTKQATAGRTPEPKAAEGSGKPEPKITARRSTAKPKVTDKKSTAKPKVIGKRRPTRKRRPLARRRKAKPTPVQPKPKPDPKVAAKPKPKPKPKPEPKPLPKGRRPAIGTLD